MQMPEALCHLHDCTAGGSFDVAKEDVTHYSLHRQIEQ
jgi:hypothetical protein